MAWLLCAYRGVDVELTDERWTHIRSRHHYFEAQDRSQIAELPGASDEVRQRRTDADEQLLVRRFDHARPPVGDRDAGRAGDFELPASRGIRRRSDDSGVHSNFLEALATAG